MKKPWGEKERKVVLSFFDYMRFFFAEGFGWLILGLVVAMGCLYLFGVVK